MTVQSDKKCAAIILAGGSGIRASCSVPKQFMSLNGRLVLDYSVSTFRSLDYIGEIIIVTHPDWITFCRARYPWAYIVPGGASRRESTYNGIVATDADAVFIHDAARPFVSPETINECHELIRAGANAIDTVWFPPADTIVCLDTPSEAPTVTAIPLRDSLGVGQTPQVFNRKMLLATYRHDSGAFSDDCGAWIARYGSLPGTEVRVARGSEYNIKITTRADLLLAERIGQLNGTIPRADLSSLQGKTALVLGGTGGIGSCIVRRLEAHGVQTTAVGRGVGLQGAELALPPGPFDIIVHAAGFLPMGSIEDTSVETWDTTMAVHLRSFFLLCKHARRLLRPGGHLLAIGSSSCYHGRKGYAAYSASKAGLVSLVQAADEELRTHGLHVNCINPPRTNTSLRRQAFPDEDPDTLMDPERVAEVAVNCCAGTSSGVVIDMRIGDSPPPRPILSGT